MGGTHGSTVRDRCDGRRRPLSGRPNRRSNTNDAHDDEHPSPAGEQHQGGQQRRPDRYPDIGSHIEHAGGSAAVADVKPVARHTHGGLAGRKPWKKLPARRP